MTIICALYDADNAKFLLGSNSGCVAGDTVLPEHRSKWLRFTNWAIAFAGPNPAHDALEAERPKFPNQTAEIGQVTNFLRASFIKYDLGTAKHGARNFGVTGLIAHSDGALYSIDERLGVARIPEGSLWACGSGMKFALGADCALNLKGFTAEERLEIAVLTAIDLDVNCSGDPLVEKFG